MIVKINGWLEQVHTLRQRLDPQTAGRRGRAIKFNVQDEVEDTFRLYGALLEGQKCVFRSFRTGAVKGSTQRLVSHSCRDNIPRRFN